MIAWSAKLIKSRLHSLPALNCPGKKTWLASIHSVKSVNNLYKLDLSLESELNLNVFDPNMGRAERFDFNLQANPSFPTGFRVLSEIQKIRTLESWVSEKQKMNSTDTQSSHDQILSILGRIYPETWFSAEKRHWFPFSSIKKQMFSAVFRFTVKHFVEILVMIFCMFL